MLARLVAGLAMAFIFAATAASAATRPFVVVLADPRGTVAPDLLTPYAILADSGAVDVKVVSSSREPVRLTPGVAWVRPQLTLAELDRGGVRPDVVIVPALEVESDPARSAWLREQLRRGVRIMSICNGARVLAAAGLLDGREATVHWYSHKRMAERYPKVTWRRDLRWVVDGPITTTAGISAAEPATLHLLAELAGEKVMRRTAARLGVALPDQSHDGRKFRLTLKGAGLVVANRAAFWRREDVALPLSPGFDEFAFGTALDAWSRTYRSKAWAAGPAMAKSRHGLVFYRSRELPTFDREVPLPEPEPNRATFAEIRRAYGEPTARFVALQFEHPYGAITAW